MDELSRTAWEPITPRGVAAFARATTVAAQRSHAHGLAYALWAQTRVMARLRRPFLEWLVNFGLPPSVGMAQLVLSGVFERFPGLKMAITEAGCFWAADLLWRAKSIIATRVICDTLGCLVRAGHLPKKKGVA